MKSEIEETNNQLVKEKSKFNKNFTNTLGKYIQYACTCKDNEDKYLNLFAIVILCIIVISIAIVICLVRYAADTTFDRILLSIEFIGLFGFLSYILIGVILVKYEDYWHYKELLKKYEKENKTKLTPFNFKQFKENIEPMIESYKNSITLINDLSNKIYNLTEELKQISNK